MLVVHEFVDQLPTLERVRFARCHRATDTFGCGNLGYGPAGGDRPGDAGKPRFTPECRRACGSFFVDFWFTAADRHKGRVRIGPDASALSCAREPPPPTAPIRST